MYMLRYRVCIVSDFTSNRASAVISYNALNRLVRFQKMFHCNDILAYYNANVFVVNTTVVRLALVILRLCQTQNI
jgi:hypothetical protein